VYLSKKNESDFILTGALTIFMAVVCGVLVANLYYIQPLEAQIASTFHISQNQVGIAAMMIQLGYAFGLLLFVPLGDMVERKSIIMRMLMLVTLSLLAIAWSPNYTVLLCAMLATGLTTIVPQLIVPYAAQLARPQEQGEVIGKVMSGLLIGILLSRAFSGMVGSSIGWRAVYIIAAILSIFMLIIIWRLFPQSHPTIQMPYSKLLASIIELIKTQRTLREAACNGFLMFGAFSAFWTSVVFLLETPHYNMGAREAGLLGLVGAAGALAAPLIGKSADKRSPRFTVGIGIALSLSAYICFVALGFHIWGLIMGAILLDLGNQCGQISNIARVQALGDQIRSRNNTVFMFSYFIGGAVGSFLGTLFFQHFGWYGVCSIGLAFTILAVIAFKFSDSPANRDSHA